ncbi:hypothetical protein ACWGK6_32065 [Streptomyces violaceusniger]
MGDRDKTVEILALRRRIMVLERQLGKDRVRFTPSDRAFLAALLHRLPMDVLRGVRLLVRPDTVLRRHRDLLARRHAAASRPKRSGRPRTALNAALKAGILQMACPFYKEQLMWGNHLRDLGVVPVPNPYNDLTVYGLVGAVRHTNTDPEMVDNTPSPGGETQGGERSGERGHGAGTHPPGSLRPGWRLRAVRAGAVISICPGTLRSDELAQQLPQVKVLGHPGHGASMLSVLTNASAASPSCTDGRSCISRI